jgi:hypothetical protein
MEDPRDMVSSPCHGYERRKWIQQISANSTWARYKVKSRRLYLQELSEDVADKEREKAYTTRVGQDCASGHHLGDELYRLADDAYLIKWD